MLNLLIKEISESFNRQFYIILYNYEANVENLSEVIGVFKRYLDQNCTKRFTIYKRMNYSLYIQQKAAFE